MAVKTPNWVAALQELQQGKPVKIYVTGLTPALVEFLNAAADTQFEAADWQDAYTIACQEGDDYPDNFWEYYYFMNPVVHLMHYNRETGDYARQIYFAPKKTKRMERIMNKIYENADWAEKVRQGVTDLNLIQ